MAMLQVRNVPDDVYATLKQRARGRGVSVSEYVRELLARDIQRLSWQEALSEARRRPVSVDLDSTRLVRELRDSYE